MPCPPQSGFDTVLMGIGILEVERHLMAECECGEWTVNVRRGDVIHCGGRMVRESDLDRGMSSRIRDNEIDILIATAEFEYLDCRQFSGINNVAITVGARQGSRKRTEDAAADVETASPGELQLK